MTDTTTLSFSTYYNRFLPSIPENLLELLSTNELEQFARCRYGFFFRYQGDIRIETGVSRGLPWTGVSTTVEVLLPDSPFIIDTIIDYLNRKGYRILYLIHPVLATRRNETGELLDLAIPVDGKDYTAQGWQVESHASIELGLLTGEQEAELKRELTIILGDLYRVVSDYSSMRERLTNLNLDPESKREVAWLNECYVFLAALGRDGQPPLGIARRDDKAATITAEESLQRSLANEPPPVSGLRYLHSAVKSSVNSSRAIQIIRAGDGKCEEILCGHFSSRTLLTPRAEIPQIDRRLLAIASRLSATSTSYMRKQLYRIAQMLPPALLTASSEEHLQQLFTFLLTNIHTSELTIDFCREEEYRTLWIYAIAPARSGILFPDPGFTLYCQNNGLTIHHTLSLKLDNSLIWFLAIDDSGEPDHLEEQLRTDGYRLLAPWISRLRRQIRMRYSGESEVRQRLERYQLGLASDYPNHQTPEEALIDLDILDQLPPEAPIRVNFYRRKLSDCIKIYSHHDLSISKLIPILSECGFDVEKEVRLPYLHPKGERYTYALFTTAQPHLDGHDRERIADLIAAILNNQTNAEPTNALALRAGLNLREIELIRALNALYFQVNRSLSRIYLQQLHLRYPDFSRALIELFHARHDPALDDETARIREEAARSSIETALEKVETAVDEEKCRGVIALVDACERSNFYLQRDEIALKITCRRIAEMPSPVPLYEIFVYAHDIEGTHLRGGMISRGGIRWSDRSDDYRTEVLGLMQAQMVKNTVIVPEGSKGGFVLKRRDFADRASRQQAGVEAYKRYISSLLDLTDNRAADGSTIAAEGIRRRDGDDSYFVVAADKGTATFSDLANSISLERNYWLTDAFASGGSEGYDHKKQGITARGAYESVRHLFRERGIDVDRDSITAVGIGDMGGDVFGNGMLLSQPLKLRFAFNHLHIFIDPDPNPVSSFAERQRLFALGGGGGGWENYDQSLLSKGGGIYPRNSRRIEISDEAATALAIEERQLSGEELIRAILRAPVDLLWNGGIGTYVKGSFETDHDARDPANDRVRINGKELRCIVIGEGGNLGFTQGGRVEAAANGVRLSSDAIDNSAGVNMSDHEVNLKILLNRLYRQYKLEKIDQRHQIVRDLEPDQIELVLSTNRRINTALSLDEIRSRRQLNTFRELIRILVREGQLDRQSERVPGETEIDQLLATGVGLTRPILAVLIGYTKLLVSRQMLDSSDFNHNDPALAHYLHRYFPDGLSRFAEDILDHPLRRQIILTEILNEVIDTGGITLLRQLQNQTGNSLSQVVQSYAALSHHLNAERIRNEAATLPTELHYQLAILLEDRLLRITRRLLRGGVDSAAIWALDQQRTATMAAALQPRLSYQPNREAAPYYERLAQVDQQRVAQLWGEIEELEEAVDLTLAGFEPSIVPLAAEIGERLQFARLQQLLERFSASTRWEQQFLGSSDAQLVALRRKLLKLEETAAREALERAADLIQEIFRLEEQEQLTPIAFSGIIQEATP